MKKENYGDLLVTLSALANRELSDIAYLLAQGVPEDHWLRGRGGSVFIGIMRSAIRKAARSTTDTKDRIVLQRTVSLLNLLNSHLLRGKS